MTSQVVVSDPNEGRDRHFKVVTKWAAFVDIENLLRFVKYAEPLARICKGRLGP